MSLTAEEFSYILALFKRKKAPPKNYKHDDLTSTTSDSNNFPTSNQAERLMDLSHSYSALTKSQDVEKNFLEPTSYGCQFCCKQFRTSSMLRQHFVQMHSDRGFKCSECFFIATSQENLTNHKCKLKSSQSFFACESCSEKFRSKRDLLLHMKKHGKKHQCSKCDKEYADLGRLQKHVRQSHSDSKSKGGGESFSCSTCSRNFGNKETFAYHSRYVHTQVRPFGCNICKKWFKTFKYLKLHLSLCHAHGLSKMKVVKGKGKRRMCSYKSVIDFMKMKRTESKEVPKLRIACPDCKKLLTSITSFYAHKVLHKDPKICSKCKAEFPWRWHLNKHEKNCNGTGNSTNKQSLKPYQCFLCNNSFANGAELTDHMKYHAKLDFKNNSSQHVASKDADYENEDDLPDIDAQASSRNCYNVSCQAGQPVVSESASMNLNPCNGSAENAVYTRANSSNSYTHDGVDLTSRLETPIDFEMFSPITPPRSEMIVIENPATEQQLQPSSSSVSEKWNCNGAMADYVLNCSDLMSSVSDDKVPTHFTPVPEPNKCAQSVSGMESVQIQPQTVVNIDVVDENSVQGILNELLDTTGPISPLTDSCLPSFPASALMVDESFVLPHDML